MNPVYIEIRVPAEIANDLEEWARLIAESDGDHAEAFWNDKIRQYQTTMVMDAAVKLRKTRGVSS